MPFHHTIVTFITGDGWTVLRYLDAFQESVLLWVSSQYDIVRGESASAGIQTRSRSGENALNEFVLRTRYVTRRGTVLSSMSKLRASLAVTHSSARKKISIWSAKVTLQFLV